MTDFDQANARPGIKPAWWISIEGIRQRFGHYLPGWNPQPPAYDPDWESHWFQFDRVGDDCLYLPDADGGDDMEPSGSFTVLAIVQPDEISENAYPWLKHSDTSVAIPQFQNQGSWWMYKNNNDLRTVISSDGSNSSTRSFYNQFIIGRTCLMAFVYEYIGPGSSILQCFQIDVTGSYSSAPLNSALGPVFDGNGHLIIGGLHVNGLVPVGAWDGKIYAVAYYPDQLLTAANLEDIFDKTIHPVDLNPRIYVDFSKPVAAGYRAEIGIGPNAPYDFTVLGSPVQNG